MWKDYKCSIDKHYWKSEIHFAETSLIFLLGYYISWRQKFDKSISIEINAKAQISRCERKWKWNEKSSKTTSWNENQQRYLWNCKIWKDLNTVYWWFSLCCAINTNGMRNYNHIVWISFLKCGCRPSGKFFRILQLFTNDFDSFALPTYELSEKMCWFTL